MFKRRRTERQELRRMRRDINWLREEFALMDVGMTLSDRRVNRLTAKSAEATTKHGADLIF